MNVYAAIGTWLARHRSKLAWTILGSGARASERPSWYGLLFNLQRLLEPLADLITSDAVRGITFFRENGFELRNTAVVFSSAVTTRFRRDPVARAAFREQHGLGATDVGVGLCSRLVPVKGYPVFASAAKRLLSERGALRFFVIGPGEESIRQECVEILGEQAEGVRWLGRVERPEEYFSGWDVFCSSSVYGEGLQHSIIEAMASELPCVVTDVGDAALAVGDTGIVVKPSSVEDLYRGLKTLIEDPDRDALGARARQRVLDNFTVQQMVSRTEAAITRLASGAPPAAVVPILGP
jgi:glycosyltransferase involved in cell wall biosynthesis